jgi:hypothetical protein
MENLKFRDLTANEIDVRVGTVGDDYITLLLYKDARVDMDILDETVGVSCWQRKHYELKGVIYCSVGIYFAGANEWVWKDDCGAETFTEKEKGESSDSFKRACVNWGLGRELYTSPYIFIKCDMTTTSKGKKIQTLKDFEVEKIRIENKVITGLSITAYDSVAKARKRIYVYSKDN